MGRPSDAVIIWTKETGTESWSKQVFEDIGRHDLVRTFLGWYVGSTPNADDLVLDNSVRSRPDGDKHMVDTHRFEGGAVVTETERYQEAVYLGNQLAAEARLNKTLHIYPQRKS